MHLQIHLLHSIHMQYDLTHVQLGKYCRTQMNMYLLCVDLKFEFSIESRRNEFPWFMRSIFVNFGIPNFFLGPLQFIFNAEFTVHLIR